MTTAPAYIACVGSRETPPEILEWMRATGEQFVRNGYRIVSGNAPGADQAWAAGGNKADPSKVTLCLPWAGFEEATVHQKNLTRTLANRPTDLEKRYYSLAESVHPSWRQMTMGGQRLHARNAMIVEGVKVVFGFVTVSSGGTMGAFRIARMLQIPCYDVSDRKIRGRVEELVELAVRR